MATRPSIKQARAFATLIAGLRPQIQRAFMISVTDLTANVDWPRLLDELERGNIDGGIAALNISPLAWMDYSTALTDAYARAASSTSAFIQANEDTGVGVRFNMQDPRAQDWVRENVTDKVVGFSDDQIKTARKVIDEGYALGYHPHTIATDLAGRVGTEGRRVGGVLGLDGPRADRLYRVKVGMRTADGVRSLITEHYDGSISIKYRVNRSTARRIISAYKKGESVPENERIISENQYYNALLKDRADTIAETEVGNAVMSARDDAWEQAAEQKGLDKSSVIKIWWHRRGASKHHRPDHLAMSGTEVEGLNTPFIFPDGTHMQHAHDPSAGPEHIIRCGCDTEYRLRRSVS